MISDMLEACRLCMCREQDAMKPIFDQQELGAKIIWISGLKVYQGDNLPAQICQQCYVRLNSAYYFKEQIIGIDRTLREMLEQSSAKLQIASPSRAKSAPKSRSGKQPNPSRSVPAKVEEEYFQNEDDDCVEEVKIEVTEHAVIEIDLNEELPAVTKKPAINKTRALKGRRRDRNFLIINNKPRPHKCFICPKAFTTKSHLTRHMLVHAAGRQPRGFNQYKAANNSKNSVDANNSSNDDSNSVDTTEGTNAGTPISSDSYIDCDSPVEANNGGRKRREKVSKECPICHKMISWKGSFQRHLFLHSGERPHQCPKCLRTFADGGNCLKHKRKCFGDTDIAPAATVAPATSVTPATSNVPVKIVTPVSLSPNHQPKTRWSKEVRERLASGGKTYNCTHCDAKYSNQLTLRRHFLAYHNGRPLRSFQCPICKKIFTTTGALNKHKRRFHGESDFGTFKCSMCDIILTSKYNLSRHMKEHLVDQPFTCNVCDKTFVQEQYFNEHIASHVRDKPFKCDICAKTFYENTLLIRHMRIIHDSWPVEELTEAEKKFTDVPNESIDVFRETLEQSLDSPTVEAVGQELQAPELVLVPEDHASLCDSPKIELVDIACSDVKDEDVSVVE